MSERLALLLLRKILLASAPCISPTSLVVAITSSLFKSVCILLDSVLYFAPITFWIGWVTSNWLLLKRREKFHKEASKNSNWKIWIFLFSFLSVVCIYIHTYIAIEYFLFTISYPISFLKLIKYYSLRWFYFCFTGKKSRSKK